MYQKDQIGFVLKMQGRFNTYKSINVTKHIKRLRDKNHVIILIEAQEATDKSNFMIQVPERVRLGT